MKDSNKKANIGSNDGKKLEKDQEIKIYKVNENTNKKKINYLNSKINRVLILINKKQWTKHTYHYINII